MNHRRYFTLYNQSRFVVGHGIYYPKGGNVQVYMKAQGNTAWQFSTLAEALLLDDVQGFQWHSDISEAEQGNMVWNRIDGAYNPNEFQKETT